MENRKGEKGQKEKKRMKTNAFVKVLSLFFSFFFREKWEFSGISREFLFLPGGGGFFWDFLAILGMGKKEFFGHVAGIIR